MKKMHREYSRPMRADKEFVRCQWVQDANILSEKIGNLLPTYLQISTNYITSCHITAFHTAEQVLKASIRIAHAKGGVSPFNRVTILYLEVSKAHSTGFQRGNPFLVSSTSSMPMI
jgi:hypothetical protein